MTMKRWSRNAGEGRAGCIMWTLLLIFGGMVAFKVIPIKIATIELKDQMREAARLMPRGTERQYVDYIVKEAVARDLPVTKKDVKVKKTLQRVVMDVEFTMPVDLIITTYDWHIKLHVDRDIFLI